MSRLPYRGRMPSVLIEVRREYSPAEEVALIDAVHASLVAAFRIPDEDRFSRLVSYPPHRMVDGPAPGVADGYTRVTIDCFPGRSLEAKRALYREIVERLEPFGIPREKVSILLRESAFENWGSGGVPAADAELGFTVEV
ncbi:phenylpyruvate tautomerase PptA (4-oxalocrotonate tautomerase family) [Microbacterium kyungheense]|uniref:Phenylpyruvate tautomerase PptA (4-oxalocrotonate tautomerase family) n=2 Tax=Microbacterium kyungheense TaxID=1263636 RepID=A0A543F245_9MICO|nr:phenylpyruvate tautomerase PptA (4-oxalocrotonate tautomerase family) [Microbacterium kyungheense]